MANETLPQRRDLNSKLYGFNTNSRGSEIRASQVPISTVKGAVGSVSGKLILGDVTITSARIDILDVGLLTANVTEGIIEEICVVTEIDATTGGAVSLYDCSAEKYHLIIHSIVIETEAGYDATGKTTNATFNIGRNAPNYDEYVNGDSYAFTDENQFVRIVLDGTVYSIWEPDVPELFLNITTPSDAAVETWQITVWGTALSEL